MWIHLLTTRLIDGAGGQTAPSGGSAESSQRVGGHRRVVKHTPLLQRVLAAKAKKLNPPKTIRERVRQIEVKAAEQLLTGADEGEFRALMERWAARAQPRIEVAAPDADLMQLFMAQVAMRLRAIEYQQRQEEEDEDEVLALLLA